MTNITDKNDIPLFDDPNAKVTLKRGNKHKSIGEHLASDYNSVLKRPESFIISVGRISKLYVINIYTKESPRPLVLKTYIVKSNSIRNFSESRRPGSPIAMSGDVARAFITHLQSILL